MRWDKTDSDNKLLAKALLPQSLYQGREYTKYGRITQPLAGDTTFFQRGTLLTDKRNGNAAIINTRDKPGHLDAYM